MWNIKQLCRLCYLSLLRLRIEYTVGAVYRVSRRFRALYHASLSQAFWKLSLWNNAYEEKKRQYFSSMEKERLYESKD